MADNKVADAYVEVGAKMDKLDKDLKRTEKKVEDGFKKTGKKAANALESPIVSAALKATASFGALELGVGGVNVAIEAMTGDIGDAAEAVKRLPAGIGPFATQLETLLGTVTGIRSEIESINMASSAMSAANQIRLEGAEASFAQSEKIAAAILEIQRQIVLLQADPGERAEIGIAQDEARAIEAAESDRDADIAKAQKRAIDFANSKDERQRRERVRELQGEIAEIKAKPLPQATTSRDLEIQNQILEKRAKVIERIRGEIKTLSIANHASQDQLAKAMQEAEEGYQRQIEKISDLSKVQSEEGRRIEEASHAAEVRAASGEVGALGLEADLAETQDPLERERLQADQRLAEREKRAMELQTVDQELAEEFRRESERIHEADLADIDRREQEKADQEREAKRREREQTRREEERASEERMREIERAEEQFQSEMERRRQEDVNMQRTIDSTEAITRQANQARQLRPGDRGFGSTAGTKEFDRPQKIESKTLEDIKVILERQLIAGDAFA